MKPNASGLNLRFSGVGNGTGWNPCFNRVKADQPSSRMTITVVICITRRAFSLDSWMPLVFCHQKYMVTATAKTTDVQLTSTWGVP